MTQSSPRIAIIGAGPAGCMLARLLLHKANIRSTIFEAEESLDYRSQGGTLDLNQGIEAVKAAGVYDEYLKFCRFDGSALGLCDKNGRFYLSIGASKAGNPEIDRAELRGVLLRSLPEGMVRWKHRLLKVDDDLGLHFEHGVETGFDLVVGADGAWSKVRNALTEEKPVFSGVAGYNFSIPNAVETAPEVSKFVNRGSIFAFSDGKSIVAQQLGEGCIDIHAWRAQEEPNDTKTDPPTKEELLETYSGWKPEILDIIRATEGEIKSRSLFMLPVGSRWKHMPGVTLLGDAAHLMTPFGGEGVNLAFQDAFALANAIIGTGRRENLDGRLSAFEKDMFRRGRNTQAMTEGMKKAMLFTEDAPRSSTGKYLLEKVYYNLPWAMFPLYPAIAAATHTFFFFYKFF